MRLQSLFEYVRIDPEKLRGRLQQDSGDFSTQAKLKYKFGSNPENFAKWLEQYDPSPKNKYVNWMIQRYVDNGISRLEDIPNGVTQALERFEELKNAKKLGADADINKIKGLPGLNTLIRSHETTRLGTKAEKIGDVDVILNTDAYSIVSPKTYEASKELACNTEWCTAFPEMYKSYSKEGPLYVITDKKTGDRWQFHFESGQFMDEKDREISAPIQLRTPSDPVGRDAANALIQFYKKHIPVAKAFAKIGKIELEDGNWKIGDSWFNGDGNFNRDPAKGPTRTIVDKSDYMHQDAVMYDYYVDGFRHRDDGPAHIEKFSNGHEINHWYQKGKKHRDPAEGPAEESWLDTETGEIGGGQFGTDKEDYERKHANRYEPYNSYWVDGEQVADPNKINEDIAYNRELDAMLRIAGVRRATDANGDPTDPLFVPLPNAAYRGRIGGPTMADRVPPKSWPNMVTGEIK